MTTWRRIFRPALVIGLALLALAPGVAAQDLEPKAYTASPVGAAFLVTGFARSSGSVLVDPTLPLRDVQATINAPLVAAGYTFDLFGKLALVTAALPVPWGTVSGVVGEDARAVTRAGLADPRFKLSVNFVGNPAMRARQFARARRRPIVGSSLTVIAPGGQYDGTRLINLGTNRWSFKPEIGLALPRGRWDVDAYVGVWLFTANHDFYPGGQTRSQHEMVALQGHLSYAFRPRLWAAFDGTWYGGGASHVGTSAPSAPMNNARLGATLAVPVGRWQSIKVAYSSGVTVRTGSNFRTLSVGWQWLWLTKP